VHGRTNNKKIVGIGEKREDSMERSGATDKIKMLRFSGSLGVV